MNPYILQLLQGKEHARLIGLFVLEQLFLQTSQ